MPVCFTSPVSDCRKQCCTVQRQLDSTPFRSHLIDPDDLDFITWDIWSVFGSLCHLKIHKSAMQWTEPKRYVVLADATMTLFDNLTTDRNDRAKTTDRNDQFQRPITGGNPRLPALNESTVFKWSKLKGSTNHNLNMTQNRI